MAKRIDRIIRHFELWCLLAAPLLADNDLTRVTPEDLAILLNKEAIAVDQDPKECRGATFGRKARWKFVQNRWWTAAWQSVSSAAREHFP